MDAKPLEVKKSYLRKVTWGSWREIEIWVWQLPVTGIRVNRLHILGKTLRCWRRRRSDRGASCKGGKRKGLWRITMKAYKAYKKKRRRSKRCKGACRQSLEIAESDCEMDSLREHDNRNDNCVQWSHPLLELIWLCHCGDYIHPQTINRSVNSANLTAFFQSNSHQFILFRYSLT